MAIFTYVGMQTKKLVGILCMCAYLHFKYACIFSESESCSGVSHSLRPHGPYSPWNSPGQKIGVNLSLLQGIFPTQGSNPGVPHYRQVPYHLSHQGSPRILSGGSLSLFQGIFRTQESNQVSCTSGRFFTAELPGKPQVFIK